MDNQKFFKQHLISSLSGKGAHISFQQALEGFPLEQAGIRVENIDHTMWQ